MKTTFALELNHKPSKAGKYSIFIRITQNQKHRRIKSSFEATSPRDWNKLKGEFRPSEPNYKKWNAGLAEELEKVKDTYRSLEASNESISPVNIKQEATKIEYAKQVSFLAFAEEEVANIYTLGRYRDWKKHNGFLNKLKAYLQSKHKKDIEFTELTPSLIADFNKYLNTLENSRISGKKLHQNTIQEVLILFRRLINKAIEKDFMEYNKNPFLKFKPKGITTQKEKLTEAEISQFAELNLEKGSLIWNARNMFLFSFYCAGIRVGDLLLLRWKNIEKGNNSETRLSYQMGKNNKIRNIVIVEEAKAILEQYYTPDKKQTDYIFPLLKENTPYFKATSQEERNTLPADLKKQLFTEISAKTSLLNKELKKLATMAEIEKKVSMHIARHTFASIAMNKGIQSTEIKDLLAHSKLTTTEKYMGEIDTHKSDEALHSLFDNKNQQLKDKVSELISTMKPEQLETLLATLQK